MPSRSAERVFTFMPNLRSAGVNRASPNRITVSGITRSVLAPTRIPYDDTASIVPLISRGGVAAWAAATLDGAAGELPHP